MEKQEIEIKEGTQSGSVVLLRGLGVTKLRGSGPGRFNSSYTSINPDEVE
jgi:DnaJ-class molecular chaperone with C-terminal Zn finger domain